MSRRITERKKKLLPENFRREGRGKGGGERGKFSSRERGREGREIERKGEERGREEARASPPDSPPERHGEERKKRERVRERERRKKEKKERREIGKKRGYGRETRGRERGSNFRRDGSNFRRQETRGERRREAEEKKGGERGKKSPSLFTRARMRGEEKEVLRATEKFPSREGSWKEGERRKRREKEREKGCRGREKKTAREREVTGERERARGRDRGREEERGRERRRNFLLAPLLATEKFPSRERREESAGELERGERRRRERKRGKRKREKERRMREENGRERDSLPPLEKSKNLKTNSKIDDGLRPPLSQDYVHHFLPTNPLSLSISALQTSPYKTQPEGQTHRCHIPSNPSIRIFGHHNLLSLSLHFFLSLQRATQTADPRLSRKPTLEMAKGNAVSLLLIVMLLVVLVVGAPPKLPKIMQRGSSGGDKGHFKVDEPVYRYRDMPGLTVQASKLMELETDEGKPEYDP